jgi:hypothetical protein
MAGAGGTTRFIRFDDAALQGRFVSELRRVNAHFTVAVDGGVKCSIAHWEEVNSVAHTIRDSCFKWYFSWWDTPELSNRFLQLIRASSLPFQLEHHEDRDIFLLPTVNEAKHNELSEQLFADDDQSAI